MKMVKNMILIRKISLLVWHKRIRVRAQTILSFSLRLMSNLTERRLLGDIFFNQHISMELRKLDLKICFSISYPTDLCFRNTFGFRCSILNSLVASRYKIIKKLNFGKAFVDF